MNIPRTTSFFSIDSYFNLSSSKTKEEPDISLEDLALSLDDLDVSSPLPGLSITPKTNYHPTQKKSAEEVASPRKEPSSPMPAITNQQAALYQQGKTKAPKRKYSEIR